MSKRAAAPGSGVRRTTGDGTLDDFFRSQNLQPFIQQPKQVVAFESSTSIKDAAVALDKHNILCAPVKDKAGDYLGLVDAVGLLYLVLDTFQEGEALDFGELLERYSESFADSDLSSLTGTPRFLPFVGLQCDDSTMLDVMLLLGQYNYHRVPLIRGKALVTLVSQSDVVRYLYQHREKFGDLLGATLQSLGLAGQAKLVTVCTAKNTAWDAFQLMKSKQVSAVGVVDAEGKLVNSISAREARYIMRQPPLLVALYSPVQEWLKMRGPDANKFSVVSAADTLGHVLDALVSKKLHRVYVVDAKGMPVRVVTLGDVISIFVSEEK
eukprot:m.8207 g.8207  ORF g.8207 m.8207 type:complete len:324 (-) comp5064_c0_seq1:40-1011(-)